MLHGFHHGLLAHHSGKDNQGNIQTALLQQMQRLQGAKRRQDIIGKDDVRLELELLTVFLFGVHAHAPGIHAGAVQSPRHQVEVRRFVFDDQHRDHQNDSS